jgi:transcriptional regulator of aroF, aroG, tyrA and aromatic amino acid transport
MTIPFNRLSDLFRNISIDVPELTRDRLPAVREALALISGVQDIVDVDMLPGMRRRLYLDALLAAMADPVLAVDAGGAIVVANAAAATVAEVSEPALRGVTLGELFGVRHEAA